MGLWSLQFVALTAVSLVLYHLSPTERRRRIVFALGSAVFVASYAFDGADWAFIGFGILRLSGLFVFAALAYLFQKYASAVSDTIHAAMIAVLLLCYILLKHIIPSVSAYVDLGYLTTVGLSYLLFRALHLVIDARTEPSRPPGADSFFAYLFFWPTFLSGPIWRFQDYSLQMEDVSHARPTRQEVFTAFSRISLGCVKVLALAKIALFLHREFAAIMLPEKRGVFVADPPGLGFDYAAAALLYLLYMYFDFSGYTDMVIGLGMLFGISIPENFNRPFLCGCA